MGDRFVYRLQGGPYHGREIIGSDQLWRVELYHHDPYALNATAQAVYGSRFLQVNTSPRLLHYWGSLAVAPQNAREPQFYS